MPHRLKLSALASLGAIGLIGTLAALAEDPKPKAATKHQNYTESITAPDDSKVNFDMVAIPGGEFLLGSPATEEGRDKDEGPQVKVKLKPFWMGKCEVSWDEFDVYFRLNNPNLLDEEEKAKLKLDGADAVSKPTTPYVDETYGHEREKHPAICMTHHAALKYCEWLSKKTGKHYRLPTEAEWEYACRAGSTGKYTFGNEVSKLADYAWYKENSKDDSHPRGTTHEIATKKPNAWGLYDMHGNVMEWCLDHYVEDAYNRFAKAAGPDGFVLSPFFKPTEKKWWHVARGGHFKNEAKDLRSAARTHSEKKWMQADPQEPQSIWWLTNFDIVGFRVVRSVDEDELKDFTSKVIKGNDEIFKPKD
jgi:formylglycine-generating enzyme required for sulfatase activity